jgi:hypothetical protein
MSTKQLFVRHIFDGGWATDFGPSSDVGPDQAGMLRVPFLVNAENTIYNLDGSPRKAPGTTKLNSVSLDDGSHGAETIKGLFDFWISGASGASTQHRVLHIGSTIKRDDADGTFVNLFTGLDHDAVPCYTVLEDILIISSDASADVPKSWDGSTAQNLAGTPPNFSFACTHKNRVWAAGVPGNPSRLYYSVLLNGEDWIGSGSGSIDIDPSDGDRITGIISHKNELWVFKGPYKGSIHRISGSSPTGDDPFARATFINGLGAVNHNTLFRARDDIGFMWSDGSIHSLNATAAYGDFHEAALSRPISRYLREHVNFTALKHCWAQNWSDYGIVLFTYPIDGSASPNAILMMDYRFEPVRWAPWPGFSNLAGCLASVIDPTANNQRIIMSGGSDGFVRKLGQPTRSIDGDSAIAFRVTLPHLTYGVPISMKTIEGGSIGIQPLNNGNLTFGWQRDAQAQQTYTVAQGGGDVLGPADADEFVLDTSTLGGAQFIDRFFSLEEGGEFRSIQIEVNNSANNEDVDIRSLSAILSVGAWSLENQ